MSADLDVTVRRGAFTLDVELTIEPGEVVAVLGPNGAGKSTMLRAIAGLVPLDGGAIRVDGDVLDDPLTDCFVPPEQRRLGVVFQDYRLFPHMTALDNVAFGLRARGEPAARARAVATGWLERVGLGHQASQRPRTLSGGEAQRVAVARALATEPRMLLLDEPLAALDARTRREMRTDLRRHLAGFGGMVVLVTHDPLDAHALAHRVAVLEDGRLVQQGHLDEVAAHPRTRYVADLVGVNVLDAFVRGVTAITASGGHVTLASPPGDGAALLSIRPQALSLHRSRPSGSPRNVWRLDVADVDRRHDRARIALDGELALVAEITTSALDELAPVRGDQLWVSVKATEIGVSPTRS